jgi:hypothetical protein
MRMKNAHNKALVRLNRQKSKQVYAQKKLMRKHKKSEKPNAFYGNADSVNYSQLQVLQNNPNKFFEEHWDKFSAQFSNWSDTYSISTGFIKYASSVIGTHRFSFSITKLGQFIEMTNISRNR